MNRFVNRSAFLFLLYVLLISGPALANTTPKNIIIMISDGMGPTAVTAAREYYGELVLDEIMAGSIRTRSHSSAVTDSAAGATAFSTGVRTYNRAVNVGPDKKPLFNLLQEARRKGMQTGLVVTSPIAHATPAAFSSYAEHRKLMFDIALQQSKSGIELILGGGYDDWLPKSKGGCRVDDRNLLKELANKGYNKAVYKNNKLQIAALPAIGLFAKSNLDYMIDHNDKSGPELVEMVSKSLELLSNSDKGFFLMIEGSRIDHAGHDNDPASKMHEIKAYDKTMRKVLEFARKDKQTLVISVSDHETGGMSIGRLRGTKSHYEWKPDELRKVTASSSFMAKQIIAGADPAGTVLKYTGFKKLTKRENIRLNELTMLARMEKKTKPACSGKWQKHELAKMLKKKKTTTAEKKLRYWISNKMSRAALVGWTTYGHTGVDVNLYATGPGHEQFQGNFKNTHIAKVIANMLDLKRIKQQMQHYNSAR